MPNFYDVFISYGRPDSQEFVNNLYQELTSLGLKVWLDCSDIHAATDWQEEINDGILKSHNFIFVISPHAVNSSYCLKEINLALQHRKRLIPIMHVEEINQATWQQRNPQGDLTNWTLYQQQGKHSSYINMHPEIGKINWTYCRDNSDDFSKSLSQILQVIYQNVDYVQQHTSILVAAFEWLKNQKASTDLLIGEERIKAESWLRVKFENQPPVNPSDLQCEYICESTKNANNLMTQIFISHVIKDQEIKEEIEKTLKRQGITIWTNKTDIQSGVKFQKEINQGIEGADNFLYLISPDSLLSKYCQQEIELAWKYQKRIIPLLIKATKLEAIPAELRRLQFIDLTGTDEHFREGISQLINQIKTDEVYYQEHKFLLVKALKWQRQKQNPSVLLRGYNLQHYQNWLKIATTKEHPAIAIHQEFIKVSSEQPTEQFLDVFISYSSADSDLARRINEELQLLGKSTWFDQESIASGADFQEEIWRGIESCDNFVFIISPKSITSPYCADEVEHAFMLNKRFITILSQEVKTEDLHPALARVQWIDFRRHGGNFYGNFSELMRTLDTDREHVRNHTKWLSRALDWEKAAKSTDLLLRGSEESIAVDWLKKSEDKQPIVTELHREFITKSREALIAKKKQEKRQILILRSLLGAVSVGFVFFVGVSLFAIRQNKLLVVKEQAARVKNILSAKPVDGLVLAIATTVKSEEGLKQVLPEAQSSLYKAIEETRESFLLQGEESWINSIAWSPDGQYLASGSKDNTVRLWTKEGKLLATLTGHENKVNSIAWSPDGQSLASASDDNTVRLWTKEGDLLTTLTGHESYVNSIAWSPDGQSLASASDDSSVKLWTKEGKLLATLTGHERSVKSIAWSPGGQSLASASDDDLVQLWNKQGQLFATLQGHKKEVNSIAWSPDGKYLASASDDRNVIMWTEEGKLFATLQGHEGSVKSIAWSPDGQYLASASDDSNVILWTKEGKLLATLTEHERSVKSIAWSPDGQYLASGSDDKNVRLWEKDGKLFATLKGRELSVKSIAWSPDGQYLASSGSDDNTVRLWSKDDKSIATFPGYERSVKSIAWSPDGQYLASGDRDDKTSLKLWSRDGKPIATLPGHQKEVTSIAWSPDGQSLASASKDSDVKLWSRDGKPIATLPGHQKEVISIAWSPDGQSLASASKDSDVKLWSRDGKLLAILKGHTKAVKSIAWSPDGQSLASASDDSNVILWSKDGKPIATLTAHERSVKSIAWSPDGQYLASASDDSNVILWSKDGKPIATLKGHTKAVKSIAWSPDGQYLASASDDSNVILWSKDGKQIATLTAHERSVNSIVWSPDGQYLASGSDDKTVRLWSKDGKLLATLTGHWSWINSIVWSPDGQYLASASDDKTVRLWPMGDWRSWLKTACHRLRDLKLSIPHTKDAHDAVKGCLKYGGWTDKEKAVFLATRKEK